MKFIHTADWQLGKPFARIEDEDKRSIVRQERFMAVQRIEELVRQKEVSFVLVAGDLFDSNTANKSTVSNACSMIGKLGVPCLVIPGNHDHGGQGSMWESDFFLREKEALAPNLRLLLDREPCVLDDAVIFPCPLMNRLEQLDPTSWLRNPEIFDSIPFDKPRILLAHGSTQQFDSADDEEEGNNHHSNLIHLDRLPLGEFDYIALGDWHGTKQVSEKAWFSGTPERDRFPKGESNQPGHVLVVEASRGQISVAERVQIGRLRWHEMEFHFHEDSDLDLLERQILDRTEGRTNEDLLRLELNGSLGLEASTDLDALIESLKARLLRLKLTNQITIAPTTEEVQSLADRVQDPLTSNVASRLLTMLSSSDVNESAQASNGLRELFKTIQAQGGDR